MTISLHEVLRSQDLNFNDLKYLARISRGAVAELLAVEERTVRRWNQSRQYPRQAVRQMALYAGFFVWPGWEDYRVCIRDGLLYHREFKHGMTPGQLAHCWYVRDNLPWFDQEINRLRLAPFVARTAAPPVLFPAQSTVADRPDREAFQINGTRSAA